MSPNDWIETFESFLTAPYSARRLGAAYLWHFREFDVRAEIIGDSISINAGKPCEVGRDNFALIYSTAFRPAEAVRQVRGLLSGALRGSSDIRALAGIRRG